MSQLSLQLPDAVLNAARKLAQRENLSVEDYVARMLSEVVRLDTEWEQRISHGSQVSRERFLEILAKAPDVPPFPGDEIK